MTRLLVTSPKGAAAFLRAMNIDPQEVRAFDFSIRVGELATIMVERFVPAAELTGDLAESFEEYVAIDRDTLATLEAQVAAARRRLCIGCGFGRPFTDLGRGTHRGLPAATAHGIPVGTTFPCRAAFLDEVTGRCPSCDRRMGTEGQDHADGCEVVG